MLYVHYLANTKVGSHLAVYGIRPFCTLTPSVIYLAASLQLGRRVQVYCNRSLFTTLSMFFLHSNIHLQCFIQFRHGIDLNKALWQTKIACPKFGQPVLSLEF